MGTGLFESSQPTAVGVESAHSDRDRYRALGGTTIVSVVLALTSPLIFFDWWLAIVPVLGVVLAVVAWQDIVRRPTELTGKPLTLGALLVSAFSLVGGLIFLSIVYAAELPEGFQRLDYTMLQPLDGDPPATIPDTAHAMNGRHVLLKGYMYPGSQQNGILQFLLVRDQGDCCFGGNPKITDRVLVQLQDTKSIAFSPRLTKIAGRFEVRPTGSAALDGGVLYHLEDAVAR
ncbi:MAG: hypothetical protein NT089_00330 [Planctomycetia bacterium]|jgi:hypothetical protein|nr:hypothetical protein [Planctomycetia bacterium]